MPKDNSDICHEGDEFFDDDLRPNRQRVKDTEEFFSRIDKKLNKSQLDMLQKKWLDIENPFLWEPMIDLDD